MEINLRNRVKTKIQPKVIYIKIINIWNKKNHFANVILYVGQNTVNILSTLVSIFLQKWKKFSQFQKSVTKFSQCQKLLTLRKFSFTIDMTKTISQTQKKWAWIFSISKIIDIETLSVR